MNESPRADWIWPQRGIVFPSSEASTTLRSDNYFVREEEVDRPANGLAMKRMLYPIDLRADIAERPVRDCRV